MSKVVILYGPPGSGKGTQAELLARNFGFVHFDTGSYLRKFLWSKEAVRDKSLNEERKKNQTGDLNTPLFVLNLIKKQIKRFSLIGVDAVFSGSPRTLFEAFGDGKTIGMFHEIEEKFGKENLFIVKLVIDDNVSAARNRRRFSCPVCGLPKLGNSKETQCTLCGATLVRRKDDKPEVAKRRIREFESRTAPIIKEAKKRKYKIISISGEDAPFKVSENIAKRLKLK